MLRNAFEISSFISSCSVIFLRWWTKEETGMIMAQDFCNPGSGSKGIDPVVLLFLKRQ